LIPSRLGLGNNKNSNDNDSSLLHTDDIFEQISFSGHTQRCCISFVDMIGSTEIIAQISDPRELENIIQHLSIPSREAYHYLCTIIKIYAQFDEVKL
jgi:hypothetical protein